MNIANIQSIVVSILFLILAVGCSPANSAISTQLNLTTDHPLAWDRLGNLSYAIPPKNRPKTLGQADVTLQGGLFVLDSVTREGFVLDDFVAYGDLNGDETEDAAVVLLQQSAEQEVTLYLYPILNLASTPHPLAAYKIGRNLIIQALTITQNQLIVTYQKRESYVRLEDHYQLEGGIVKHKKHQKLPNHDRPNPPPPRPLQLDQPDDATSDVTGLNPYLFDGQAGQSVEISVASHQAASFLSIIGADGTVLKSIRDRSNHWQGQLPTTQPYTINVVSFGTNLDFTLVAKQRKMIANAPWTPRPISTPPPSGQATPQGKWTPKPPNTPRPAMGTWTPRPTSTPRPTTNWQPNPTKSWQTPVPTKSWASPTPHDPNVIYLTFDDGPYPKYTNQIIELLNQYGAKASFFVIGRVAQYHMETIDKTSRAGHVIANHTWNHYALDQLNRDGFYEELLATQNLLGDYQTRCLRPPYGAINSIGRAYAAELGYVVLLWQVDTRDWSQPGADAIINTTLTYADSGDVILLHDGGLDRSQTVTALQTILPALRDRGYRFETIKSLCH